MINAIQAIGAAISTVQDISGTSSVASAAQSLLSGGASGIGKGQSFADVMTSMASDVTATMKKAEVASLDGLNGKANTREVVDAVMNAEQSLQTAISIRDKVVTAYLEIARMQI